MNNSLETLIENIFDEIDYINRSNNLKSIPYSTDFFPKIAKKYNLVSFNIPKLMEILVNSHKIFSFKIINEDRKNKILPVDGFVITKGDVMLKLADVYGEELVKLYAVEFNKKLEEKKAIQEFERVLGDYNNTPIGEIGSIAINVSQLAKVLEWDIAKYSERNQEKLIKIELEKNSDITFVSGEPESGNIKDKDSIKKTNSNKIKNHRAKDSAQYKNFMSYSQTNTVEKTIAVYGIEFYTRVCFRDYNFNLIQKHVSENIIKRKNDLIAIKKLLQRERANSDKDSKMQEYASEINSLEKIINEKLK